MPSWSQHLEDAVNRTVSSPIADANRDDAIDPVIFGSGGLEQRIDAEVIARRINRVASFHSIHDVGGAVARALIRHADEGVVLCLKHQTDIQDGGAIVAHCLPIAVAIEHLAGQALSLEVVSRNYAYAPKCGWSSADNQQLANVQAHYEQRLGVHILENGVYSAKDGEAPVFYALRAPDTSDVVEVAQRVAMRVAALLEKQDRDAEPEEPALAGALRFVDPGNTSDGTSGRATCEDRRRIPIHTLWKCRELRRKFRAPRPPMRL